MASSAASGAAGASSGGPAASEAPNHRRMRPGFPFFSGSSLNRSSFRRRPMRTGPFRTTYVPMTPEETRARLLYRDGLMLVLDKPAGVAVHRGPKGGSVSRTTSTRSDSAYRASPHLPIGSTATPPAALFSDDITRLWRNWGSCSSRAKLQSLLGDRRGFAGGGDRRSGSSLGRLDDTRGSWMKVDPKGRRRGRSGGSKGGGLARRGDRLARARAATGRTRRLRVHCASQGCANPRRCDLRRARQLFLAVAGAQGRRATGERKAAGRSRGAGPRRACWRRSPPAALPGTQHGLRRSSDLLDRPRAPTASVLLGGLAPVRRLCDATICERLQRSATEPSQAMSIRAAIHHLTHLQYDQPCPWARRSSPPSRPAQPHAGRFASLKVTPADHFMNFQQARTATGWRDTSSRSWSIGLRDQVDVIADMTVYNPFDFFVEESTETWPVRIWRRPEARSRHLQRSPNHPERGCRPSSTGSTARRSGRSISWSTSTAAQR